MKWRVNPIKYNEWHSWFAWHPVKIVTCNGTKIYVWLEYIEHKLTPIGLRTYHNYRLP